MPCGTCLSFKGTSVACVTGYAVLGGLRADAVPDKKRIYREVG